MDKRIRVKRADPKFKETLKLELPEMHCKHCGKTWTPRFPEVRQCPACKTTYFRFTKEEVYKARRKKTLRNRISMLKRGVEIVAAQAEKVIADK